MKAKQRQRFWDRLNDARSAALSDGIVREDDTPITLVFHKSTEQFSYGATNFSPTRLIRLLGQLHRAGFRLALTFDDGYAHLVEVLPAVVEQFGISPLVLIPTECIGKPNQWDYSYRFRVCRHLNRNEIRTLDKLGVRIGSHGHRHVDLTAMGERALPTELRHSKRVLEDLLGKAVTDISYPFGRHNEAVERVAGEAGFERGYSMRFPEASDRPMATGRIPIYGYDTTLSVLHKLSRGHWRRLELLKAAITNRLSGGTILVNRFLGDV